MDESLYYLQLTKKYMESYQDVSIVDSFFEGDGNVKQVNQNNENVRTGAMGALQKAFDAIIALIKKICNRVSTFVQRLFMSSDQRHRFDLLREQMRANPEFANKEITVKSFKEYDKMYNEALNKLDNAQSEEEAKSTVNNLFKKISGATSRAAMTVTLETALEMANRNKTVAKQIKLLLDKELAVTENIRKQLGDSQAVKFKKKIDGYSRAGMIHRFKVKVLQHKEMTLEAVMRSELSKLSSLVDIKDDNGNINKFKAGKAALKNRKLISNTINDPNDPNQDKIGTMKKIGKFAKKVYATNRETKKRANEMHRFRNFILGEDD